MTLRTQMLSHVGVFINTDEFAETVTFYPGGDAAQSSSVSAVVDYDALEGTRESFGDGVTLQRPDGEAIRESIHLHLAASVDVDATRRPPDLFKIDDVMWVVKRVRSKDLVTQTVLCTRRDNVYTRRPTKSG